jgi:5'-phosphate synthase pdxT subunit
MGVLALQGDFAAHGRAVEAAGQPWIEVKYPEDLRDVSALIIPGGESTTLMKFLSGSPISEEIVSLAHRGVPVYGSCAGAILLAGEIMGERNSALGLMDIAIERNAYGRQIDSFIASSPCPELGPPDLEMVFIRAPVVRRVGTDVKVLASWKDHPVFLKQGNVLLTTFHPELSPDTRIHRMLAAMALQAERAVPR